MAQSKVVVRLNVAPKDMARAVGQFETGVRLTEDQLEFEGCLKGAPSEALKTAFGETVQVRLQEAGITSEWAGGFIAAAGRPCVPGEPQDDAGRKGEPPPVRPATERAAVRRVATGAKRSVALLRREISPAIREERV